MKLSNRELDLVSKAPRNRQMRKRAAWTSLAVSLASLVAVHYFDFRVDTLGLFMAVAVGVSISEVFAAYFRIREQDKLTDLLLRYVNSDPHAVEQLSLNSATMRSPV